MTDLLANLTTLMKYTLEDLDLHIGQLHSDQAALATSCARLRDDLASERSAHAITRTAWNASLAENVRLCGELADERAKRFAVESGAVAQTRTSDDDWANWIDRRVSAQDPRCSQCGDPLMFSSRQRGDGLCGSCSRTANGTQTQADLMREAADRSMARPSETVQEFVARATTTPAPVISLQPLGDGVVMVTGRASDGKAFSAPAAQQDQFELARAHKAVVTATAEHEHEQAIPSANPQRDAVISRVREQVMAYGITRLLVPVDLDSFHVLHPDSVMPTNARAGVLPLDWPTYDAVKDLVTIVHECVR